MATYLEATNDSQLTGDADFRLICQMFHSFFATGLTQTSDTGQINTSTVTRPLANNAAGYEIFRFSDSLQATAPVFIKVEMGCGASNAVFGTWITMGTGSDGAGNITGTFFTRTAIAGLSNSTTVVNSYASGDTNRLCFCAFSNASGVPVWFSVERTKDTTGADTATGLLVAFGQATTGHQMRAIYFGQTTPTAETGLQFVLSTVNPSTFGSATGIGIAIPMRGTPIQPGYNIAVTMLSDFAVGASFTVDVYGASHTYQIMANVTTLRAGLTDGNTRLALRYE